MSNLISSPTDLQASIMAVTKIWAESRSKDPTSKVGACIYDPVSGGLFLGYNGFPPGIPDNAAWWNNRSKNELVFDDMTKYEVVVHAEVNAVRKALKAGVDLSRAILYCTHAPCPTCMKDVIISNGIRDIYYENDQYASYTPRAQFVVKTLVSHAGIHFCKLGLSQ